MGWRGLDQHAARDRLADAGEALLALRPARGRLSPG